MIKLDCTKCGGASYSASAEATTCPYCGHKLTVAKLPPADAPTRDPQ